MKKTIQILVLTAVGFVVGAPLQFEEQFKAPPMSARPHTWWHWMGGNVTKEGIAKDLQEMKKVGLAGATIFDIGSVQGPVVYASPQWLDLVQFAVEEADRLGLEIVLSNGAGFSSSGGPWIDPEHAMQVLTWSEKSVQGPVRFSGSLPQPSTCRDFYRDVAVIAVSNRYAGTSIREAAPQGTASAPECEPSKTVDGDLTSWTALPVPTDEQPQYIQFDFGEPYAAQWLTLRLRECWFGFDGELQASDDGEDFRLVKAFDARPTGTAVSISSFGFDATEARFWRIVFLRSQNTHLGTLRPVEIAEVELDHTVRVNDWCDKAGFVRGSFSEDSPAANGRKGNYRDATIDLTSHMQPDGTLDWDVPSGNWTILRIGATLTGAENHPAPKGGGGLECDKLCRDAFELHWNHTMGPVIDRVGALAGKTLTGVLVDSYEVGCQNWTPDFREEFSRRRGYDPFLYLPSMTGRVTGRAELTDRFLWDVRRTLADLFRDNYYGFIAELAHRHGMQFLTEGFGVANFNNLAANGVSDMPMGVFWSEEDRPINQHTKVSASSAHTYGHRIIGAEAYTTQNGDWRDYPYSLKSRGDTAFCRGINRYYFHTFAHQPWPNRRPGMTMGPHGLQFQWTQTWWEQAPAWIDYISRCQFMLQQGVYVADVCFYAGENSPSDGVIWNSGLPDGYQYDSCDPHVLLERMTVKDGRIVLPDGMSYRLLVLPNSKTMTPVVVRQINRLVRSGATVIGSKPLVSPSLQDYPQCDAQVRETADALWGACDGKSVKHVRVGDGQIFWNKPVQEVLNECAIEPDLLIDSPDEVFRSNWIHRRDGDTDIYFIANPGKKFSAIQCSFRGDGRSPEIWHPDTGEIEPVSVYKVGQGRTEVSLALAPCESVFVVFRNPIDASDRIVRVEREGKDALCLSERTFGELMVLNAVYGKLDNAELQADVTEALRRKILDNALNVQVNNRLAGHDPARGSAKQLRVQYGFGGTVYTNITAENRQLILPKPVSGGCWPMAELISQSGNSEKSLLVYEPGKYRLTYSSGNSDMVRVGGVPETFLIKGAWDVAFKTGWDVLKKAEFDRLVSWTDRPESKIRYFSGTAVYTKTIDIPADMVMPNHELFLDLGNVVCLAEVTLNGHDLGVLWKPPFRLNVTNALKPGPNRLEIRVTNNWINRLIGDEQNDDGVWWQGKVPRIPSWHNSELTYPPGRQTWVAHRNWSAETALQESGLLGPVEIRSALKTIIR